jgi:methylenetetrahydrofolate dehydrogenase (NADP+)/methenyltetrahydrofolate cyclohydrolase
VIVDAGIGFIDGQLTGDVDISALAELDVGVTPVPGGVGPLTSVLILENLLNLIEMQSGNESTLSELAAR